MNHRPSMWARMLATAVLATVFAGAAAHASPAIVDSSHAAGRGLMAVELTVPVPAGVATEGALGVFLDAAEARGARAVGRIAWVWIESRAGQPHRCTAPLVIAHGARGHLRVAVGWRQCEAVAPWMSPGRLSELHGEMYLAAVPTSTTDYATLGRLLEPEDAPRARPVAPRARRASPSPRRRLNRRQIRALSRELE